MNERARNETIGIPIEEVKRRVIEELTHAGSVLEGEEQLQSQDILNRALANLQFLTQELQLIAPALKDYLSRTDKRITFGEGNRVVQFIDGAFGFSSTFSHFRFDSAGFFHVTEYRGGDELPDERVITPSYMQTLWDKGRDKRSVRDFAGYSKVQMLAKIARSL